MCEGDIKTGPRNSSIYRAGTGQGENEDTKKKTPFLAKNGGWQLTTLKVQDCKNFIRIKTERSVRVGLYTT